MEADREGTFIIDIYEYGIFQADQPSKSVGVILKAKLLLCWDFAEKVWEQWETYDMHAEGTIWVVKKDGTTYVKGAESLIQHAGWDGKFSSIANNEWQPTRCQVVIKEDNYNDQTRYKIAFINALQSTPGGGGNVDADGAKKLDTLFGSSMCALAANAAMNAPKTATKTDKPSSPPKPAPATAPPVADSDIPF